MADVADVVVIGGGCSGASIAWQLARRGVGRVVLLEQTGIAAGATGRSSAVVRTHYTHEALARMSLAALRIFERFDELVGGDVGFHRVGMLVLLGPEDVEAVVANVAMHRRVGIEAYALTLDALMQLEPRLNPAGIGAIAWEPQSGYADPVLAATAFAEAGRRLGVDQRIGVRVNRLTGGPRGIERVETSAGQIQTRTVVVAAGYRSRELLAPLGFDLPLRPIRHTIAIVQRSPRGAGALLRLALQKLMPHLGEKGKNMNGDIASLVASGLDPGMQQALDALRVIGNNAVHPGELDLQDNVETVGSLFGLINYIVEQRISHPKKLQELYNALPEGARAAIADRDTTK